MNKLTALSKLASAFHYLYTRDSADSEIPARVELDVLFGQIRRSLRIEDLKPQPKQNAEGRFRSSLWTEGLNPTGPKFF